MLEEVVVSWQEVRWIWCMRQNFIIQVIQLLKHWLCNMQWALSWRVGPFHWPRLGAGICSMSSICWAYFSDVMVSPGFRKLQWLRTSADHQTVAVTFFGASLALGSTLELLLGSTTELVVAGHWIKSTLHLTSQSSQEMVHCCCKNKRRQHMKIMIFFFLFSSWGTHLSSFFTFPICFKRIMTVEWLTLSSLANSPVVVRGSVSMILSIGRCHLPRAGHCTPIFKVLVSFAKLLERPLHCTLVSNSWAKCTADAAGWLYCFTTHFELK